MQKIYILIKELGSIEQLSISDSLSDLLWREELGLTTVDSRDMRVRNLEFSYSVYEASLDKYRNLSELAELYHKMDTAILHYQQRYSLPLVNFIVGDVSQMLQGFDNDDTTQVSEQAVVDIQSLPQLVLQRIKQYFVAPFLIKDAKLSEEKHANIKYVDDTAEFRVVFTVLDVALPDDRGQYQRQPLTVDVLGRFQDKFTFYLEQAKTDKDRYFGYDNALYDKRHAYLSMILSRCKDKQGRDLATVLDQIGKEFVYDFWLDLEDLE